MKTNMLVLIFFVSFCNSVPTVSQSVYQKVSQLEQFYTDSVRCNDDWLIHPISDKTALYERPSNSLIISNGLISRTFSIHPDGATIGYDNIADNVSLLRAVKPEAIVEINGMEIKVGGLLGQPVNNYFRIDWISNLKKDESAMHLVSFESNPIKERFPWKKRLAWMPKDIPWPAPGVELIMKYQFDPDQKKILSEHYGENNLEKLYSLEVDVHYEIYDGLPLLSKWIEIKNNSTKNIILNHFKSEILAYVEPESVVGDLEGWQLPNMTIETDYAFGGSMSQEASAGNSYSWIPDEDYETIINYTRTQPSMLVVTPHIGPGIEISKGENFKSYRVYELIHDSFDKERKGLSTRKMYRTISPWVTENPVLMHVRKSNPQAVKLAIDQCVDVGFEMVIMTFGSGFNLEDSSRKNLNELKELSNYAHERGIALGGYSLLASRSINKKNDVVMPEGKKPTFNNSPCLQSDWGRTYFENLYDFYRETNLDILEHDGSYPGDPCLSKDHPGHTGYEDSQWKQFNEIADFYKWCRSEGIYLNVPDWYFLNGSNKTAMGYRETNWSLPRAYQEIIERQNIYDGTWEKTPSMGWMFVPLVQYHGGGDEATIEPLKEHLDHYEQRLANLFGGGVQACYRGPRLFDAPETRKVVKRWVDFYKRHREVLDSDIIHVRRPDGNDYDGILHVNPGGEEKGLLMLYNPLDTPITKHIALNIYYTGLKNHAEISFEDGAYQSILVNNNNIELDIIIPANKWTWYVIK